MEKREKRKKKEGGGGGGGEVRKKKENLQKDLQKRKGRRSRDDKKDGKFWPQNKESSNLPFTHQKLKI